METKRKKSNNDSTRGIGRELPIYTDSYNFEGYDPSSLMAETAKIRNLITKRGTLEILIPLCCSTKPVRYKKFREAMKGISSKTLLIDCRSLKREVS
jgi:DNA-binding HxlR family transcriptional regulator